MDCGQGLDTAIAQIVAEELDVAMDTVTVVMGEGSGLHGIRKVKGGYIGGADPRRDGVVIGD